MNRNRTTKLVTILVLGGAFSIAGTVVANRIAAYDPATSVWSALGSGMNGEVWALTALPNGDLVAGGPFTSAGGVSAPGIARWNGTSCRGAPRTTTRRGR